MEQQIVDSFAPGGTLLDLGCGGGGALELLSDRFETLIGVDVSDVRLDRRGGESRQWEFIRADSGRSIPLRSGSVDAVLANQVIEHILDPVRFVKEIHRVLRVGGRAVITTPNARYARQLWRLIVTGRGPATANGNTLDGNWDDGHVHYFTHRDLREVLNRVGFTEVRSRGLVNLERGGTVRRLFDRGAALAPIREFGTGNILLTARKGRAG